MRKSSREKADVVEADSLHSGKVLAVSETAGNIQTLWDFSFRQSKQEFRSGEKLSGAVYKGNQSYSLLIICLFPVIKLQLLDIRTNKV